MNIYIDSSALVKRYLTEPGTEAVQGLFGGPDAVAGSALTAVEVPSAISRAKRAGIVKAADATRAIALFQGDWARFVRIPVDDRRLDAAAVLAERHCLRALDAVHLASALSWAEAIAGAVVLATFDRELWLAAREAGLAPWPQGLVP